MTDYDGELPTYDGDRKSWELMLAMARKGSEAERRAVMRLTELAFNPPPQGCYCPRCREYHTPIGNMFGSPVIVCTKGEL